MPVPIGCRRRRSRRLGWMVRIVRYLLHRLRVRDARIVRIGCVRVRWRGRGLPDGREWIIQLCWCRWRRREVRGGRGRRPHRRRRDRRRHRNGRLRVPGARRVREWRARQRQVVVHHRRRRREACVRGCRAGAHRRNDLVHARDSMNHSWRMLFRCRRGETCAFVRGKAVGAVWQRERVCNPNRDLHSERSPASGIVRASGSWRAPNIEVESTHCKKPHSASTRKTRSSSNSDPRRTVHASSFGTCITSTTSRSHSPRTS